MLIIYLFFNAVVPLTVSGGWRGIADVIAVGFYLLGIIPLGGMALLELGVIIRKNAYRKLMDSALVEWCIARYTDFRQNSWLLYISHG